MTISDSKTSKSVSGYRLMLDSVGSLSHTSAGVGAETCAKRQLLHGRIETRNTCYLEG